MNRRMGTALSACVVVVGVMAAGILLSIAGVADAAPPTPTPTPTTSSASPSPSSSTPTPTSSSPNPSHSTPPATPKPKPTRTAAPPPPPSSTAPTPTPTPTSTTATPTVTTSSTPTSTSTTPALPDPASFDPAHATRADNSWLWLLFGGIGAVAVVAGAWLIGLRRNRRNQDFVEPN